MRTKKMEKIYKTYYNSPIGKILLASDGKKLIGLWFEGQKYFAYNFEVGTMILKGKLEIFLKTKAWLDKYFRKEKPNTSEIELELIGSEFRINVWKILCNIPYGETITYGEIANKIAKKLNKNSMSAQAIGNAVGHNPISIIIPCHRVVGTDGNLTGYAGGIDKKIELLKIEDIDLSTFYSNKM